ncbi:MAG: putative hydrolase of the superfamily [Chloroflexia bacterium]|jgi:HAD superfamily hydrolase (TIGR01509 family)|nr:putative hydrolase of the superfamily [Chloroflexia bacterium]
MKKVVLFDFHNTLATCDSWLELEIRTLPGQVMLQLARNGSVEDVSPRMLNEAERLFRELRQEVRETGVELSAVEGARWVLEEMGIRVPDAELEHAVETLEYACLPETSMIEGADRALEKLRNEGYQMGVVSSAGYPLFVELALEKLGLRTFFSEIVTSAGEGLYKSNPEIFRLAARRLGAEPSEAIHVGDHAIYDVQTAKSAGLSTIWFTAQARTTARLHNQSWDQSTQVGSAADAVVDHMDELYEAVVTLDDGR